MSGTVVPFRRPKKPPEEAPQARCPECGWKMPNEMRADRDSIKQALRGEQLLLYLDCPECGASLFYVVKFELGAT